MTAKVAHIFPEDMLHRKAESLPGCERFGVGHMRRGRGAENDTSGKTFGGDKLEQNLTLGGLGRFP